MILRFISRVKWTLLTVWEFSVGRGSPTSFPASYLCPSAPWTNNSSENREVKCRHIQLKFEFHLYWLISKSKSSTEHQFSASNSSRALLQYTMYLGRNKHSILHRMKRAWIGGVANMRSESHKSVHLSTHNAAAHDMPDTFTWCSLRSTDKTVFHFGWCEILLKRQLSQRQFVTNGQPHGAARAH